MNGYRTYIVAGLMGVASVLYGTGVIDASMYATFMGTLNGAAAASIRAGMKNDAKDVEQVVKVETQGLVQGQSRNPSSGQYQSRKE